MRVFVAGATGALGRPVVRYLVEAGHEVTGMTRHEAKRAELERAGVSAAVADALDREMVARVVEDARPEAVLDLLTALPQAGPMRPSHFDATDRVRREGTANVLEAATAARARRYVAESIAFLYRWDLDGPAAEDAPLLDLDRLSSAYRRAYGGAVAKERRVLGADGIEGIVLRFGSFYGPETGTTQELVRLARRGRLYLPAGGPALLPWIHIEDAAAATVAALERGRPREVYNVVDDDEVTVGAFAAEVARRVDGAPPRAIPTWVARIAVPFAARFFTEPRLRVSNQRAKRELGWEPSFPTHREGLSKLELADA